MGSKVIESTEQWTRLPSKHEGRNVPFPRRWGRYCPSQPVAKSSALCLLFFPSREPIDESGRRPVGFARLGTRATKEIALPCAEPRVRHSTLEMMPDRGKRISECESASRRSWTRLRQRSWFHFHPFSARCSFNARIGCAVFFSHGPRPSPPHEFFFHVDSWKSNPRLRVSGSRKGCEIKSYTPNDLLTLIRNPC